MTKFPIDEAQLVALFMESVFYGIYLVTFGLCVRSLVWRKRGLSRRINWPLLLVAVLMGIVATIDLAFGLRHILDAFIFYHGAGGPKTELSDISYWVNAVKTVTTVVQTGIGDGILIYRCYIVYGHKWRPVLFSLILWMGGFVCGIFSIYITITLKTDALLGTSQLRPFVVAFLAITLALNLLTTSLVVLRIWRINRQTAGLALLRTGPQGSRRNKLEEVMLIVIESGLMYTTAVLLTFVTYLAGSNAAYGTSDILIQTVGISFNLVIIRLDNEDSVESYKGTMPLKSVKSQPSAGIVPEKVEVMVKREVRHDKARSSLQQSDEADSFVIKEQEPWSSV